MQGKFEYSNQLGKTSYLQYKEDTINIYFVLTITYLNYVFHFQKDLINTFIDNFDDWINTKPDKRDKYMFVHEQIKVSPCLFAPTMESLVKIRITHPKKGMDFDDNEIFKVVISNHEDIMLTLSDLKNIVKILRCN